MKSSTYTLRRNAGGFLSLRATRFHMGKCGLLFVLLFLQGFANVFAQRSIVPTEFNQSTIAAFHLSSTNGQKFNYKNSQKLSCFFFLSPDCPLCKNYSTLINSLKSKYDGAISFYLVVPGETYSRKEIANFSKDYLKKATVFQDENFKLSHYLQATVTPEVVLIETKTGKPVYRGALDNWAVSLGKQRRKATENYLTDAIDSYQNGQVPPIAFTEPVGCLINDF